MTTIDTASREWASRPSDQRFLDLQSLQSYVESRRVVSREIERMPIHSLRVGHNKETDNLFIGTPSGLQLDMTNWSFGQLCREAGAPADYIRRLPSQLAAVNLQYGLRSQEPSDTKVLFTNGDGYHAKAFNGVNYGRIWDADVVSALMNTVDLNRWSVPLEAYHGVNSIEATTLYASDRDVFIFLTDQTRPIEVDGNTYFRGFFTWNSEVGRATFGITTFLFSYVCANRIIWNSRDVEELRIRHTSLAPSRFLEEAEPVLRALSEASDRPIIESIRAAKDQQVAPTAEAAERWLQAQGFGKKESIEAVSLALQGGDTGADGNLSMWSMVNAGTALSRSIQNADNRVNDERRWSALLKVNNDARVTQ